jgi:hypothetical protein
MVNDVDANIRYCRNIEQGELVPPMVIQATTEILQTLTDAYQQVRRFKTTMLLGERTMAKGRRDTDCYWCGVTPGNRRKGIGDPVHLVIDVLALQHKALITAKSSRADPASF